MKKIFIIMFFSFTLLPGCSSTFAYNNIDWLANWYMDDYIDLDKNQKRIFDKNLDTWLTWHRASELRKYQKHLQQLQDQLQQGVISAEQWITHFEDAGQHWYRVRGKIVVDLAAMAGQLSEPQINALFDKLEEENVKRLEERAELNALERASANIEKLQDRVKDWIGHLSVEQKNIIVTRASELEPNFVEWIRYRRNIQRQARLLLLQRHEKRNFIEEFMALIDHPEVYQSQSFINRSARNKRVYADLLGQLNAGLSAKQMKKLNNEIEALIEDINDLVDD